MMSIRLHFLIPFGIIAFYNVLTLSWAGDYAIGTNVTLTFHHELERTDSSYFVDVFGDGSDRSFVVGSTLNPSGLKPGQNGRFRFEQQRDGRNLTFQIIILRLEILDDGVYVVTVVEDGALIPSTYKASVYVTYPHEKAQCQVDTRIYPDNDWHTVNCNATLSSDGSGILACFQNSKRLPYLQPHTTDGTVVTAVFWMDPAIEAICCSAIQYADIHTDSCADFVYNPPTENVQTTNQQTTTRVLTTSIPQRTEHTTRLDSGTVNPLYPFYVSSWTLIAFLVFLSIVLVAITLVRRRFRYEGCMIIRNSGNLGYTKRELRKQLRHYCEQVAFDHNRMETPTVNYTDRHVSHGLKYEDSMKIRNSEILEQIVRELLEQLRHDFEQSACDHNCKETSTANDRRTTFSRTKI